MNASRKIRWGLIGASKIAREWIYPALRNHQDCEVVSVHSRDPARAAEYGSMFGGARSFTSLDDLLSSGDLDAVYISTTNERHHAEAIASARAGKHILCEKPLALSVADAREMLDVADRQGVVFATNHHLRNLETHRTIRRIMKSGVLGRIVCARLSFCVDLPEELRRWRLNEPGTGAGVIYDLTVHDADLMRFYFDAEPVAVSALALTSGTAAAGVPDNAVSIWEFPGKILVSCEDTFLTPYAGTRVEIQGTEGSVVGEEILWQKPGGTVTVKTKAGQEIVEVQHVNAYDRAIDDFVQAVRGSGSPSASGHDGLRSLELAAAAMDSIATGRTVRL